MAIDSLLAQTDDRWHCYLQDDNSNDETLAVIEGVSDNSHFTIGLHDTTEEERQTTTRYSVLINEILPILEDGVVCTMCDNVTYEDEVVEVVLEWFESHQEAQSAYVTQTRDMYHLHSDNDAGEYMGWASEFGHWAIVPPSTGKPVGDPYGKLDHSQVFHRLPLELRWCESHDVVRFGDAEFYIRLVEKFGPIECITTDILSCEHLLYERIHGHG